MSLVRLVSSLSFGFGNSCCNVRVGWNETRIFSRCKTKLLALTEEILAPMELETSVLSSFITLFYFDILSIYQHLRVFYGSLKICSMIIKWIYIYSSSGTPERCEDKGGRVSLKGHF